MFNRLLPTILSTFSENNKVHKIHQIHLGNINLIHVYNIIGNGLLKDEDILDILLQLTTLYDVPLSVILLEEFSIER